MNYVPDFVVDAMNVYRTRNYIVKQSVGIKCSEVEDNIVLSHDTFIVARKSATVNTNLFSPSASTSTESVFTALCTAERM